MDAVAALADLTEISSQIETAVVVGADGSVLAATTDDASRSELLARTGTALLDAAAGRLGGSRAVTQVEAVLRAGSVFALRDAERGIVATTTPSPTSGLVFYDLKTCLRSLAAEPAPKAKPRRRRPAKAKAKDDADA